MAMVGVDYGSLQADSQPKSSGLVLGQQPLGAILHSSNEPGELSQWLCHDDSTINIVLQLLSSTQFACKFLVPASTNITCVVCHMTCLSCDDKPASVDCGDRNLSGVSSSPSAMRSSSE